MCLNIDFVKKSQFHVQMHIKTPFSIHFIPEMYSFFNLAIILHPKGGKFYQNRLCKRFVWEISNMPYNGQNAVLYPFYDKLFVTILKKYVT
jgi:hypothetical protein